MLKEFKEGLITIVNISKKMESVEKTNKTIKYKFCCSKVL